MVPSNGSRDNAHFAIGINTMLCPLLANLLCHAATFLGTSICKSAELAITSETVDG